MTVTPDEYIVVADSRNHRMQVFTMDGDYVRSIEGEGKQCSSRKCNKQYNTFKLFFF